ncbi:hypothetical protein H6G76_17240 [Nostoc sp. FACHB-152]|uniref:DUF6364 family protein n=1 Tax=unclassified Nostoc TaxID=2593658 RepID=UPI0016874E73|nr:MULTISPECIES: DUF6364 family protein [unclassified Nostoc]MBD2448868.1 hypothetical protein [Nostoc sp. FACHB-152]MBD2469803.1 hypothetical protein [Nostoc sp. FACHB-145]
MQTKLTLRLDDALVKKAKKWAKIHNISLSEAIATFFEQLPDPEQPIELSSWTQSLVGILNLEENVDDSEVLQQQYLDYLEDKYQ